MNLPIRHTLPPRRRSEVYEFDHEGVRYRSLFSRYPDGSIAEMFLDAGKTGTSANVMAKETAVILSIARQYGAPLDVIWHALPKLQDGAPAGPVGVALHYAFTPTPPPEQQEALL